MRRAVLTSAKNRILAPLMAACLAMPFATGAAVPNDPRFEDAWHLRAIGMPAAWEFAKGSPTVKVAVLDTGVDLEHPDLRDRIWTNPDEIAGDGVDNDRNGYVDDVHGWDFVNGDADPNPVIVGDAQLEGVNHGTLVSGLIAAAGGNGEGSTGVNWNARIMPLRVLDSQGSGSTAAVDAAIRYAIAEGAKVINISFTGPNYNATLANTLRLAHRAGVIVVAAAGNEGDTEHGGDLNARPSYPVCYRGAAGEPILIGVASVDRTDRKSSFSSYGSDCVTVSAPGSLLLTTQVFRPDREAFSRPYGSVWSGSSLSAPIVAGAAALLASMHPSISPDEVRELIASRAVAIDALNPGYAGQLGAGRLDVAASVEALQARLLGGAPNGRPSVVQPVGLSRSAADFATFAAVPVSSAKPTVLTFRPGFKEHAGFDAYARGASSDASVALIDPDGDGVPLAAVGAPKGEAPYVRLFTLEGALVAQFLAFDAADRVGVRVSAIEHDGRTGDEILVASGPGRVSEVRVFDQAGKKLAGFLPYGRDARGGARAAALDVDADGIDEIAVVSSSASKSAAVFGADGAKRFSFDAFASAPSGGLDVAAGDVDDDGRPEIVIGAGAGAAPLVAVFDHAGARQAEFLAFDRNFRGGVTVGVASHHGARARILAGQASGGGLLRVMSDGGTVEGEGRPFGARFRGGVRASGPRLFKGGQ